MSQLDTQARHYGRGVGVDLFEPAQRVLQPVGVEHLGQPRVQRLDQLVLA
ncbi:hypothetical protein ACTD5D_23430 [Nocardia takedensis]